MTTTPDPIEAAIEAGARAIAESVFNEAPEETDFDLSSTAIRAAAPILREHYVREGREVAGDAIDAAYEVELKKWGFKSNIRPDLQTTYPQAARIARGGQDE